MATVSNTKPQVGHPEPSTFDSPPTADEIAAEAYEIYVARGREDGHDQDDWLEAERRLAARARDRR